VGNFDPGRTFEAVRRLEYIGRDNALSEAPAAFVAAKAEVSRLIRALRHLKKTL
jgi:hypothetical protein